ncbi:MAG: class I SAM-dependent methyltransferase [Clostridiaceae bacterium]|nr:class I SAM-dependent methyltransferase [Clostridiaceae bacterium]
MEYEPSGLEIFLTHLAFKFCGKSVYNSFADRLPLKGRERVLDFGCGMGTVAYYTVQKLPYGHLTCLDISRRWLNSCRKTLRGYKNINYLLCEFPELEDESFDVIYCHFVLHDISESDLEKVIPALIKALKAKGIFAFREPLNETCKLNAIKHLLEKNRLFLKNSRITDIPIMGNALESLYIKE